MPDCEFLSTCPFFNDKNEDVTEITEPYTIKDISRLLHIHVNTARRWSDQGIIKSYRISRRGDRRFRKEDIARFLAEYNDFNMKKAGSRGTSST
jgi:excisionase family DNA binding protein